MPQNRYQLKLPPTKNNRANTLNNPESQLKTIWRHLLPGQREL